MDLDLILVGRDSGAALSRALPPLQRFAPDARVVIVDNASRDDTPDVVRRLAPGATLISNPENRGFAAAVNQGLGTSRSEFILLANPDISSVQGDIGAVIHEFGDDPSVAAVAVRMLKPDGELDHSCRAAPQPFDMISEAISLAERFPDWRRPKRHRMLDWDYRTPRQVDAATGALLFLRREALGDVGPLDERFFVYYEETDWLIRAKARGWRTVFTPAVQAVHASGTSTPADQEHLSLLLLESQHRYADKHFGPARAFALRAGFALLDGGRAAAAVVSREPTMHSRSYLRRVGVHLGKKAPR